MAGLRKQEEYNWKDSNLALFGSDVEKKVKLESAQSEPAWAKSGEKVGLEIWRIVQFKVVRWPVEDYGKFYEGDSYIILNTYKNEDEEGFQYDVHFWIGKNSTQDEYGTAAYKTVELDTFHHDKPIQHREVQIYESQTFKSYFPEGINYLKGGAESGFRHVSPTEYQPRLFHVHGDTAQNTVIEEVSLKRGNINDDDVFILDAGLTIYQLNGEKCDKDEKVKAMQFVIKIKEERNGKAKSYVYDGEVPDEVNSLLEEGEGDEKSSAVIENDTKRLMKISDQDGELKMEKIAEGDDVSKDLLDPNDVFLVDVGTHLYVWVGNDVSRDEKKNGMSYASNYLNGEDRFHCPITVLLQEQAKDVINGLI